jgi:seryl-tRNA synthetase
MLDIKFIRENAVAIKDAATKKNLDPKVIDDLLVIDAKRRELMTSSEALRAEQKKTQDRETGAKLKEQFKEQEEKLKPLEKQFNELMVRVPNIISPDVPMGKDESENKEVFRWIPNDDGSHEPKKFDFTPKDHMALGKDLDLLDFEKGTKIGGFRGYYVKNEGVLLVMGIMMYAIQKMVEKGFKPMIPPTLVKEFALFGTGYFKGTEYDSEIDEIYEIATSDKEATGEKSAEKKFLVGTSEPSLLAYYSDEVLKSEQLPIKNAGYSQCYRSEIGS